MTNDRPEEGDLGRLAGYRPPDSASAPDGSEIGDLGEPEAVASAVTGGGTVENRLAVTTLGGRAGNESASRPEGGES